LHRCQFSRSNRATHHTTKFATGNSYRIFPCVRVFQWSSIQMLANGLFDYPAGDCGEIVIFA
jgi:hypothetical protein